jgi:hypothetical protein
MGEIRFINAKYDIDADLTAARDGVSAHVLGED